METTEESGQRPVRTGAAMTLRERIARIINPSHFVGAYFCTPEGQQAARDKADAILALLQSDEAVERVARALAREGSDNPDREAETVHGTTGPVWLLFYADDARAALAALLGDAP